MFFKEKGQFYSFCVGREKVQICNYIIIVIIIIAVILNFEL